MPIALPCMDPISPVFPPVADALREPNGLLCMGGNLSPATILDAYRSGIFPWFSGDDPLLWWSPDPRMVFRTDAVHLSSKFRRTLRKSNWEVRFDEDFAAVIATCASTPRAGQQGTWIVPEMIRAYTSLHRLGFAHSVEVFADNERIGGLYGLAIGQMFFGESMFSLVEGGSKVALAGLAHVLNAAGWPLIDCQVENPHLVLMGGINLPRADYLGQVATQCRKPGVMGSWRGQMPVVPASALATLR